MTGGPWVDVAFWTFSAAAAVTGWRVFRTDSMVRASYFLLASFVNVGAIVLLLTAQYLGFAIIFMMGVEMTVMAVFMVMFMMNPGGLMPMSMVHQPRVAALGGVALGGGVAAVALASTFPSRPVGDATGLTAELGVELLGDSMLIFESAGVTLLAAMIAAVVLSSRRGRYGEGDEGSAPPALDPEETG